MKVVALAGGVGGAKLADGLARRLAPKDLTVIVNTGDDLEHLGLFICPDLDTVCYTLAGLANPVTGWGRKDETWRVMENLKMLGGPGWFNLGDSDIATHLERTRRLRAGEPLSQVIAHFCKVWNIAPVVLPMSDQPTPTRVICDVEGELAFQEYFVQRQCQPRVSGFRFEGIEKAAPAPGVLEALADCDLVVVCPSNPWVSVDPILSIRGIREAIRGHVVVAVSPIIGGKTVKGPAAKMFSELGIEPSAKAVAEHYMDFLTGMLLDDQDALQADDLRQWGIIPYVTDIFMHTTIDRENLAAKTLDFGAELIKMRGE